MKKCLNCNVEFDDSVQFCNRCGSTLVDVQPEAQAAPQFEQAAPQYQQAPPQYQQPPVYADPSDHTAEFDAQDISDNKCYAMLLYLMSIVGIVIALLASKDSPYLKFHIRQAIKFEVCTILSLLLLIIPFLGWAAYVICIGILAVLKIIAFFQICSGKAKEPAIIKSLSFLK